MRELTRRSAAGLIGGAALTSRAQAAARPLPQPDPALWEPQGLPVREGFADGPNGRVYVRTYGEPSPRIPLIVLHGGPAAGHRYMLPYAALAARRQVAFYDQSGCGRSAASGDLSLYTVARYVDELEAVRSMLGWRRVALLGHSWGGMLAPAYADAHPGRTAALVLAGSAPAWRDFQVAGDRWLAELGPTAVATVREAERTGRSDTPSYQALLAKYYALHLCRLDPWPRWLEAMGEALGRNKVYAHLNGPSEFQFSGAFSTLDVTPQLRRLRAPVLVTCGEFDEAPSWVARRTVAAAGGGAKLRVFDGLSHLSHVEDPSRVTHETGAFLEAAG